MNHSFFRVGSWQDLYHFGIDCLTGEACGVNMRILCDVNKQGKRLLEKVFGAVEIRLPENWNSGNRFPANDKSIGAVLLPYDLFTTLTVFALLENGYRQAWLCKGGEVYGVMDSYLQHIKDEEGSVEEVRALYGVQSIKTYGGTAGDRNRHEMSGRVQ